MCACVRIMLSLCMGIGHLWYVGGLFNGSHDITFSLDYRRLDDGSPPGYSSNRWANRQDFREVFPSVRHWRRLPQTSQTKECFIFFKCVSLLGLMHLIQLNTSCFHIFLSVFIFATVSVQWQCPAEEHCCKQEKGHTQPGMLIYLTQLWPFQWKLIPLAYHTHKPCKYVTFSSS